MTAASVSTTGTISSAGIGSGLDVNSIVSKLMSVEDAPLTQLQTAATTIQTTISTYGALQSAISTFRDAALALTQPSTWSATTGSSSNTSAVTVTTGSNAAPGNYSLQVQNLASSQSTVSETYASSSSLVGSGTLHIDLGTWSTGQAAFTTQTGNAGIDIPVAATDTLASLAQNINAANAGVSASIVTDTTGARLVLTASTTGTANGFRVTATDSDGNNTDATGLSALAYDPPDGAVSSTLTQGATNANATINGLPITSSTNTLNGVLQGLTVNLQSVTTTPVQVSVAQDTSTIKTQINTFVTDYNSLSTLLNTDLAYNATTSVAGPLQGDGTALTLQRQLQNILGSSSTASSVFSTLSQAGIQIQTNGTLSVNDATLTNALSNPTQIQALFAADNLTDPTNSGFAQQFRALGDSVLGIDGLVSSRVSELNTSLSNNSTDQTNLNTRLAATEARIRAQYTALDTQMASITTLSTYVTQQIANWNKSS